MKPYTSLHKLTIIVNLCRDVFFHIKSKYCFNSLFVPEWRFPTSLCHPFRVKLKKMNVFFYEDFTPLRAIFECSFDSLKPNASWSVDSQPRKGEIISYKKLRIINHEASRLQSCHPFGISLFLINCKFKLYCNFQFQKNPRGVPPH